MRQLAGSLCSLGLGISAFCGSATAIDRTEAKTADAVLVRTAGEQQHFALALRSAFAPISVRRHVVLVDTSASQTGIYRTRTLAALQELLNALPSGHEVQLVSADSVMPSAAACSANECPAAARSRARTNPRCGGRWP